MTDSIRLFGVRVDAVSMETAVDRIRMRLRQGPPGYVVTLNAAMLGRAARDERFRRTVNAAALVTADGMGTLFVARILGMRLPERVAGVDLTDRVCALCARDGYRVFLFGAAPGVADAAARRLAARHPGLIISGTHHGYGSGDDAGAADRIRTAGTDLVVVALGSPRQELWLEGWLLQTGARAGVAVGGTLDVYAGRNRRAPGWVRRVGIEWLYRLAREPRRWRTAMSLPGVIWMAVMERVRRRGESRPSDGY